jgi:hypothetical protein
MSGLPPDRIFRKFHQNANTKFAKLWQANSYNLTQKTVRAPGANILCFRLNIGARHG